ncbi:MAG TPA: PAS domain S-box protein [Acidimicrobiales bacterium]|nr:PAS domain S-box protein [Acidimicrobiales bacterium]
MSPGPESPTAVADIDVADPVVVALLESVPDGVLVIDASGALLHANRRAEELFGYGPGEMVGSAVDDLVPDRYRADHAENRRTYHAHPRSRPMGVGLELRARRRDGTERPVEISLSPVVTETGTHIIASVRDVTSRLESEAHARRVQRSLDAIRDGVFMFEPVSLRYTYVNQGAIEQVGWSRRELLGMTPLALMPEFTETGLRELLRPLLSRELGSRSVTTTHRRRDGSLLPVELVVQCPEQATGQPPVVVALVRDVSERLENEERLRAARQEMQLLEDRERIARDLHDTVIQRLFATGMTVQAVTARVEPDVATRLDEVVDDLDATIKEIRTAIFGLQAHSAWGRGIRGEVLKLAKEAARNLGFEPRVRFDGPVDTLVDGRVADELLPTLREALANIVRHADADDVDVVVRVGGDRVVLLVSDDGRGPSAASPHLDPLTGHGLRNLAARAEALGGWCELRAGTHRGATLEWDVPLDG